MSEARPRPDPRPDPRYAPLIVTAELPPDVLAWVDGLRRAHFPPERNVLRAHVTLFHALPPWLEGEARALLADLAAMPPPQAMIARILDLGRGTALGIDCPPMLDLRETIAERFHGLLTAQDSHGVRLHVTVQNKVQRPAARALQAELAQGFRPRGFRFHGLGLHVYEGGPWRTLRTFAFRGRSGNADRA